MFRQSNDVQFHNKRSDVDLAGRPSAERDVEAEESMRDVPGEAVLTPEATRVGSSLLDAQPQLQGAHIAHRAWQQARRWQQMCTVVLTGWQPTLQGKESHPQSCR